MVHISKNYSVAETSNQETKPHTWRAGELRFIILAARGVTTSGPEPQTEGLQSFYRQSIVDNSMKL